MRASAARWPSGGSVRWAITTPGGTTASRSATVQEANAALSRIARAAGVPLTIIVQRHPNATRRTDA